MNNSMEIKINIEHFKLSLLNDGFTKEEIDNLTENKIIEILNQRINRKIEKSYLCGLERGLYD